MFEFPQHLTRVRAWDRKAGCSIEVWAENWKWAKGYDTVQVFGPRGTGSWFADRDDLDFRYFGEPPEATPEVRRQWARRLAGDRRDFWRVVHGYTTARLEKIAAVEPGDPEYGTWLARVARTELARRAR